MLTDLDDFFYMLKRKKQNIFWGVHNIEIDNVVSELTMKVKKKLRFRGKIDKPMALTEHVTLYV